MSETAPGRAAYEASAAVLDKAGAVDGPAWPWDKLPYHLQAAWDAAAQAAIEAARVPSLVINFDEKVTEERAADIRKSLSDALAEPTVNAAAKIRDLTRERDSLAGRVAELEGLLAEAAAPTAGDYGNAAEILRLREQLAGERAGRLRSTGERDEARAERARLRRELAKAQDEIAEILAERPAVTGDERRQDAEWRARAGLEG